jgi:hypothetical protein
MEKEGKKRNEEKNQRKTDLKQKRNNRKCKSRYTPKVHRYKFSISNRP